MDHNNNSSPLVSIVTICFNAVETIEQTINSIIGQSYVRIEYIVVDGGSSDGTLDVLNRYRKHFTALISGPDKGISDAMNKGINMANGLYIGMVHADDWLESDAVEKVVRCFMAKKADVVCGGMKLWANEKQKCIYLSHPEKLESWMTINHPATFVRVEWQKAYLFDINLKYCMDYDVFLRMKLAGAKFHSTPEIISNMRMEGLSNRKWISAQWEVVFVRAKLLNKFGSSFIYFIVIVVRSWIARILKKMSLNFLITYFQKKNIYYKYED